MDLEKFRARPQKRSEQKGLVNGEVLTLLEQTAQLTHTPSNREKCTKSQNISPTFLSGAKLFGHVSHSTELVHCVWLVNTLTSTAPIGSPIVST